MEPGGWAASIPAAAGQRLACQLQGGFRTGSCSRIKAVTCCAHLSFLGARLDEWLARLLARLAQAPGAVAGRLIGRLVGASGLRQEEADGAGYPVLWICQDEEDGEGCPMLRVREADGGEYPVSWVAWRAGLALH